MKCFRVVLVATAAFLCAALGWPRLGQTQGIVPLLDQPQSGCYEVAVYGVAMFDRGAATIEIAPPPGTIQSALLEWVAVEDVTPGALALDGTSTLLINDIAVDGLLAEPFVDSGNAGYDPAGYAGAGPPGWFSWHADLGPDGYGLVPAVMTGPLTLSLAGWDSPAAQTNGATLTLLYTTETCSAQTSVQFLTGVNWYHQATAGQEYSQLLVFSVEPEPIARAARLYFSHAGTDRSQSECRGGAIWMLADDGASPPPSPTELDLAATADVDGDGITRGHGINGGVEIINDPFTSATLPCTPALNPRPDEPYAAGHPYPNGAASAPYRALNMQPATGGDVGMLGEWGVVEATVVIPANAGWVAFQLESEADQDGESGSWVGGGVFVLLPPAKIGDRVWADRDADGLQDEGEPGVAGVGVALLDDAGSRLATAMTDPDGFYAFEELDTGAYALEFSLPARYRFTIANAVGPEGEAGDSDADPESGRTATTQLEPGEVDLSWDAGLVRLEPGIAIEKLPDLQQVVYFGEVPFTIIVTNTGDLDLFDVVVTDPRTPACDRLIGALPVGDRFSYTCTATAVMADFRNVATAKGSDEFGDRVEDEDDAEVDVLPQIEVEKTATPEIVPGTGATVTFQVEVVNLVYEPLALFELNDDIFGDLDGRGSCALPQTLTPGRAYLCTFDVWLVPDDAGHHNTVTAKARDDEGNIAEDDDDATVIKVKPATNSSIGDWVWIDSNANGRQDAGEAGVEQVLVSLYSAAGDKIAQQETGAGGFYRFEGLEAGDYYLTFYTPNSGSTLLGYTVGNAAADDLDSDVIAVTGMLGRTAVMSLPENTYDPTCDAGLVKPTAEEPALEPDGPPAEDLFLPIMVIP